MNHGFISTFLALAVSASFLTACNKTDTPKTEAPTKAENASASVSVANASTAKTVNTDGMPASVANMIIQSPYMDFQVTANRAMTISAIEQTYPNLTDVQKACLSSIEGNANYLSVLEPYFKGILSDDEIKQADEFLVTSAGDKFKEMMYQAMGVPNRPPFIEPDGKEKVEITKAMMMPFVAKVKAKTDVMSDEEATAFLQKLAEKELIRCNIR